MGLDDIRIFPCTYQHDNLLKPFTYLNMNLSFKIFSEALTSHPMYALVV